VVIVPAVAYTGVNAHMIRIRASIDDTQPAITITGLPIDSVTHTRDRIYAAIIFPVKSACRDP
jgi:hypothetical protein